MRESLDIDPILREYLEQRRGLTGDEIQRLLVEWNNHGSLLEFLASKSLLDRTTARMLSTAAKGLLVSTADELRTVLGVRMRRRKSVNPASTDADVAVTEASANAASASIAAETQAQTPEPTVVAPAIESPPDPTPPTQPNQPVREVLSPKKEEESRSVQDSTPPSIAQQSVPSAEQVPSSEPRQVKKGSGRRGFLGASDEEMRHILRARTGDGGRTAKSDQPSTAGTTPTHAAPPSTPVAPQSAPAATASAPAVTASAPAATASAPAATASAPSAPAVASPGPSSPPVSTPVTARPVSASRSKPEPESKLSKKPPTMSDPQISAVHSAPDLLPIKQPAAGSEPKVGMYLDRYYLEESIGEGATATIFRSFHKLLRIPVAIKIYKREAMADDPIGVQRFLSEAQILIRLEHPNIVRVLDIAVRDGAPYIVFEYVGELSLQGMINNMGLLPPLRIAQIGAQVAGALEAANSNGLLHRDVKPDNPLFRRTAPATCSV